MTNPLIGTPAPEVELPATGGRTVRLSDYRGQKVVVLYFYPKDETPGCTVEACGFRDAYETFVEAGAEVIGVSGDDVRAHESFARRHRLPFVLASDPGGKAREAYGVKSTLGLLPGRETFVIDRDGVVRDAFFSQIQVRRHVARALEIVRDLSRAG